MFPVLWIFIYSSYCNSLPDKFLLYVGAIEERKNIDGILKISDKLAKEEIHLPVVLIGSEGFGFEKI